MQIHNDSYIARRKATPSSVFFFLNVHAKIFV